MNVSYEGIGQWAATFACAGVTGGQVVKVSANGTVAKCAEGGSFDGVVLSVARDGNACSVAMGGMVTVSYSGESAPAAGWNVTASMPNTSPSSVPRICSASSAPCALSTGCSGCSCVKPGSAAMSSSIFGLYFIVQEPSG